MGNVVRQPVFLVFALLLYFRFGTLLNIVQNTAHISCTLENDDNSDEFETKKHGRLGWTIQSSVWVPDFTVSFT